MLCWFSLNQQIRLVIGTTFRFWWLHWTIATNVSVLGVSLSNITTRCCHPRVNDEMCKSKVIYINTFTIQYKRAASDPVCVERCASDCPQCGVWVGGWHTQETLCFLIIIQYSHYLILLCHCSYKRRRVYFRNSNVNNS